MEYGVPQGQNLRRRSLSLLLKVVILHRHTNGPFWFNYTEIHYYLKSLINWTIVSDAIRYEEVGKSKQNIQEEKYRALHAAWTRSWLTCIRQDLERYASGAVFTRITELRHCRHSWHG